MSGVPSFEEAQEDLSRFLASQGHPTRLTWVFREDVDLKARPYGWALARMGKPAPPLTVLRLPLPEDNTRRAQVFYERARSRGLGVQLIALCKLGSEVACYVWAPQSEQEGMNTMTPRAGLKLSIHNPLEDAVVVRSPLMWALRMMRLRFQRRMTFRDEIPSRNDVSL